MTAGVVIVGAGQGGVQVALSLREKGYDGPVTVIGDEPGLPYQRPPLSKAYLANGDADALTLRPAQVFAAKGITLRTGERVDAIDRSARCVMIAGEAVPYDTLVLATGTKPFVPPIDGIEQAVGLRTLQDAAALRVQLTAPRHIGIIGAGFIGMELAAAALKLGHRVSVFEAGPRAMARAVSTPMAEVFQQKLANAGADLLFSTGVSQVSADRIDSVPVDLVVLAVGVRPETGLAAAAGLPVANGITVDRYLRTIDPSIYAVGDCACFPDPVSGAMIRLESVQAATDHARCVAAGITGHPQPYAAVPWFWSDQGDAKLQIAGLAMPGDDAVQTDSNCVLRFRNDVLVAVETVNAAKLHMIARRVLAGAPVRRDSLDGKGYDLTTL